MKYLAQLTVLVSLLLGIQAMPICNDNADPLTSQTTRLNIFQKAMNMSTHIVDIVNKNISESCRSECIGEVHSNTKVVKMLCDLTTLSQLAIQVNSTDSVSRITRIATIRYITCSCFRAGINTQRSMVLIVFFCILLVH